MMVVKNKLFNISTKDIDVDGETFTIKEMSASAFSSFLDIQAKIEDDKSISDNVKSAQRYALMCVHSLVNAKGVLLYKPDDYLLLVDNVKLDRLQKLASEIFEFNYLAEDGEEKLAKNS